MILVIGGSSKIGSAAIAELRARGEQVRALARDKEATAPLQELGAGIAVGDLADPASLEAAMTGVAGVFLLSSPHPDDVSWHTNAIDAAAKAGVSQLVRSSILGADPSSPTTFVRHHGEVDAYLQQAGLNYAILRPNYFQQNIIESVVPSIDAEGRFFVSAGQSRISMTDTRDVGAAAAILVSGAGRATGGPIYDLTGPAALSHDDVAEKLSARLDRPLHYVDAPLEATAATLRGYGLGDWMVTGLVELYQDYQRSGRDGYAAKVTDQVEAITGHPARSLDALIDESLPR
ncbi:MAG TPA: NmrA family NAD(P)-binding protein [Acidimicrobiales bacterium]|nr:NmrA family NAD(P)-binding protein [Acidimicrobiales bacterium]